VRRTEPPGHLDAPSACEATKLAVGRGDGAVELWDLKSERRRELGRMKSPFLRFATVVLLSPGGRRVAAATEDGRIKVWTSTGRLLGRLKVAGTETSREAYREAPSLAFSSDGDRLVIGDAFGQLRIWRPDGAERIRLGEEPKPITAVAFSPDDSVVVAGSESGRVTLWDLDAPVRLSLMGARLGRRDPIRGLGFASRGSRVVAVGEQGRVRIALCEPCHRIDEVLNHAKARLQQPGFGSQLRHPLR
jgi:WD40 repeat protein